jgi:hypothetical protein
MSKQALTLRTEFGNQIRKIADKIGVEVDAVAKRFVGEAFSRIIQKSPVDTGNFRNNWNFAVGEPDASNETRTGGGEGLFAQEIRGTVAAKIKLNGETVYLTNSLPYAHVLEYGLYPNPPKLGSKKRGEVGYAIHTIGGYSMQAPHGMVRVTVAEIDSILQEAVSKK